MTNEEKARAIIGGDCKKENCLECGGIYSAKEGGCVAYQRIMQMAQFKDEQIKAIAEIIADIFGSPFEYSPLDEDLLENEVCENCCNGSDCNDALCWMKYFEMKYKNKMTNNAK